MNLSWQNILGSAPKLACKKNLVEMVLAGEKRPWYMGYAYKSNEMHTMVFAIYPLNIVISLVRRTWIWLMLHKHGKDDLLSHAYHAGIEEGRTRFAEQLRRGLRHRTPELQERRN